MDTSRFSSLIKKYLEGSANRSERKLIESFFDLQHPNDLTWDDIGREKREKLQQDIWKELRSKKPVKSVKRNRDRWNFGRRVAAIAAIIFFSASMLWLSLSGSEPAAQPLVWLTKETPFGVKSNVTLSDGTQVHLNSGSALIYPEVFGEEERVVTIRGDAFFDVAENPDKPFVVHTQHGVATVLGTSFMVVARDSAETTFSLVSGKLKVASQNNPNAAILLPGKQAVLSNHTADIRIKKFNKDETLAWHFGTILFKKASAKEVFTRLARWYGVEFSFDRSPREVWSYSATFENMSLDLVLQTISYSKNFTYQRQNNLIKIDFHEK